jgi:signal transduction histidine kinase
VPEYRLFRTTAFRLTVLYLGLFVLSVSAVLGLIYWFTIPYAEAQNRRVVDAEIQGLQEHYRRGGLPQLADVVARRSRVPGSGSLYLLTRPDGVRIAGNLDSWPSEQPDEGGWIQLQIADHSAPDVTPHSAAAKLLNVPGGFRLLVGQDLRERQAFRRRIETALVWALVLAVGLGGLGGALISRRVQRRVETINAAIGKIMGGALTERLPLRGSGDEFDQLAANVNSMLDQIELLLSGMRHITEGVAHDLRTPLNRLRSRIETALRQPDSPEAYRTALEQTIAEADSLITLFNALLSIAEVESSAKPGNAALLALAPLARDVVELYEPVAEGKRVALSLAIDAEPTIRGHGQLLSQALVNLLDNAVKYTPSGGSVSVTVETGKEGPRVTVADTGPGIPEADRERVLQRFVRLEASRQTPGSGLGLSLVAAVARLHRARLVLSDNEPGLRASLIFPE